MLHVLSEPAAYILPYMGKVGNWPGAAVMGVALPLTVTAVGGDATEMVNTLVELQPERMLARVEANMDHKLLHSCPD